MKSMDQETEKRSGESFQAHATLAPSPGRISSFYEVPVCEVMNTSDTIGMASPQVLFVKLETWPRCFYIQEHSSELEPGH